MSKVLFRLFRFGWYTDRSPLCRFTVRWILDKRFREWTATRYNGTSWLRLGGLEFAWTGWPPSWCQPASNG